MTTAQLWFRTMRERSEPARDEAGFAVARNTASFRRRMGYAQETLAEEAGLPRKTIYNAERHGTAGTRTLEKLARVFGVSVATMLEPDAETAEAVFLAKQVDRLSARARETFFRSITNRTSDPDPKSIAAETSVRARRGTPVQSPVALTAEADADRQFASAQVPMLFRLPEVEWRKRLAEEPRFMTAASAWEMLAEGESMNPVNPRMAASRSRLALHVIESLAAVLPQPPHELRAAAWKNIGWALRSVGEYTEAEAALDHAEKSAQFCMDGGSMLARVKLTRAILLTTMERLDEALLLVRESHTAFREINDAVRCAMADEQEAIIHMKGNDAVRAVPILKRLLKEATSDETKARRYGNLARAFELAGDLESARRTLKKAHELHAQLGWTHVLLTDQWVLGKIMAKAGDVNEGLKMLDHASAQSQVLDDADTAVRIDLDRCQIEIENNRQTDATYDRLRAIAAYAIDKRLPQSECRALLFLQQLGRTTKPAHIRHVKEFIEDLAKHPHREFVPPELAA